MNADVAMFRITPPPEGSHPAAGESDAVGEGEHEVLSLQFRAQAQGASAR